MIEGGHQSVSLDKVHTVAYSRVFQAIQFVTSKQRFEDLPLTPLCSMSFIHVLTQAIALKTTGEMKDRASGKS
jgi:hypothetical protein